MVFSFFLLHFGPAVPKRNGPVENGNIIGSIWIHYEITGPLELHPVPDGSIS